MTGNLDVFIIQQLRTQASIYQLKQILKPLKEYYDSDHIWSALLGPASPSFPDPPNIDKKTSLIDYVLPKLSNKTIYTKPLN